MSLSSHPLIIAAAPILDSQGEPSSGRIAYRKSDRELAVWKWTTHWF